MFLYILILFALPIIIAARIGVGPALALWALVFLGAFLIKLLGLN